MTDTEKRDKLSECEVAMGRAVVEIEISIATHLQMIKHLRATRRELKKKGNRRPKP